MRKFLKVYFIIGLMALSYVMGWASYSYGWFPYKYVHAAFVEARNALSRRGFNVDHPGTLPADPNEKIVGGDDSLQGDELIAYMGVTSAIDTELDWIVIDRQGRRILEWRVDREALWKQIPKMTDSPTGHAYSFMMLDDGDLLLNFENHGVLKTNLCGEVKWHLPRRTHHSIVQDNDGYLWSGAMIEHVAFDPDHPHYQPPFTEFTVLKFTDTGKAIKEWSIFDILKQHDLEGLLLLTSKNSLMNVTGDTLHVNKVAIYTLPDQTGFFKRGDIMLSIRNANTILVFDRTFKTLKFHVSGVTIRQHDPEFVDGNTISVFDNRNIYPLRGKGQSRILEIDAPSMARREILRGTKESPFYSSIVGFQEYLANDDILISESLSGRLLQIDKKGKIKWYYLHTVGVDELGYVYQSQILKPQFNKEFFAEIKQQCLDHKRLKNGGKI